MNQNLTFENFRLKPKQLHKTIFVFYG